MLKRLAAFLGCAGLVPTLQAQVTLRVSVDSSDAQANDSSSSPSLSDDGRFVAFGSWASNLVAGDNNGKTDVFVRDLLTGQTMLVSVDSSGAPGNGFSGGTGLSADGTRIVFGSDSTNLVPGDSNGLWDLFVRDLASGQTTLVSVSSGGVQADGYADQPVITPDGRFVAFETAATNLVAGDTNGLADIFVRDLLNSQTVRASLTSSGAEPNDHCRLASLSGDGRYVAFQSSATNLVTADTNGQSDVFVRDLVNGTTIRASVSTAGAQAGGSSTQPLLSRDARFLLFSSTAANLVTGDTNGSLDVFVRDLLAGVTTRVNLSSSGAQANGASAGRGLSADARFVLFMSSAQNVVAGDTNLQPDVFMRDRATGITLRASVSTPGGQGNGSSNFSALSPDGRYILFQSEATNLVAGDTNGADDIFLRDRGALADTPFCFGDGSQASPCPCGNLGSAGRGCENSALVGGALLELVGFAEPDSVLLSASSLPPSSLAIFLQGDAQLNPGIPFGDGLRCAGGALRRLYAVTPLAGTASAPQAGDLALGARSSQLGDPLFPGMSRVYQAWYRDSDPSFCPAPAGDAFNASNAVRVDW